MLLNHPADSRSYTVATSILVDLNIRRIALLTNNPEKIAAIQGPNSEIEVARRVEMIPKACCGEIAPRNHELYKYIQTKVAHNLYQLICYR